MVLRAPSPVRRNLVIAVVVVVVVLALFVGVGVGVYTDLLFFREVGFTSLYTNIIGTRAVLFLLFGALMAVVVGANIVIAYRLRPPFRPLSQEQQNLERYRTVLEPYLLPLLLVVTAFIGLLEGISASGQWKLWLLWQNGTSFGTVDPQFGRDISYYAFTYPFQRFVLGFAFVAVVISLIAAAATHYLFGGIRVQTQGEKAAPAAKAHVSVLLGIFALLKAYAYYLDRFGLNFSDRGFVQTGASYTDVNAVLTAKNVLVVISLVCAVLFFVNARLRGWTLPGASVAVLVVASLVVGGLYPLAVQRFSVTPDAINKETPYISRAITATRQAYGIEPERVTVSDYPALVSASAQQIADDKDSIPNARLLDPNVLQPTYEQLQQIRGYYGFAPSLDIDRYTIDGVTQDYVLGVRELDQNGIPGSRSWLSDHLLYTHGLGIVAAPANESVNGQPVFKDGALNLPPAGPVVESGEGLTQPRVYYGEQAPEYSVVRTTQQEIDGPQGEGAGADNTAKNTYSGLGGVPMGSLFKRAVFALKYNDQELVTSGAITSESRIMYNRQPRDRVKKVAPWLELDGDPYPVVVGGRILWVLDGYTTSDGYPYSERRELASLTRDTQVVAAANRANQPNETINYIRNSVKATVDAYDGSVKLYAFDEQDPVLRTWRKAFPGLVKDFSELQQAYDGDLIKHIRYPEDLFKVQRDLLARFHIPADDPATFFSGEDFWNVPDAPGKQGIPQPPYYLFNKVPGQADSQFNLTSVLVARNRPNISAFLSVSSDMTATDRKEYGQFRLLRLPTDTAIQGPNNVVNQIESDATIGQQLNLLRNNESTDVIGGNLLTLPVADGLLYIRPYYVKAKGGSTFPTLQKVAAVFGDRPGFADTLQGALNQVFGGAPVSPPNTTPTTPPTTPPTVTPPPTGNQTPLQQALGDAQTAYTDGQAALARNDFAAYGDAQKRLKDALDRAAAAGGATTPPATSGAPAPSGSPPPSESGAPAGTTVVPPTEGSPADTQSPAPSPAPSG